MAESLFSKQFRKWVKHTEFNHIISNGSVKSDFLRILDPDFDSNFVFHGKITTQNICDYLSIEEKDEIIKRDASFYIVISAISNSKLNMKQFICWIKNLDKLALKFDYTIEHSYFLSFAWTLEKQESDYPLFTQTNYIDNLPNTLEPKYIKYFMHKLIEKEIYDTAFRFSYRFISESNTYPQLTQDVTISLVSESDLLSALSYIRKTPDDCIESNLCTMAEYSIKLNKYPSFCHVPFTAQEQKVILDYLSHLPDNKYRETFITTHK